eukprot:1157958-Pelagomonas_calceolata.AAC.1
MLGAPGGVPATFFERHCLQLFKRCHGGVLCCNVLGASGGVPATFLRGIACNCSRGVTGVSCAATCLEQLEVCPTVRALLCRDEAPFKDVSSCLVTAIGKPTVQAQPCMRKFCMPPVLILTSCAFAVLEILTFNALLEKVNQGLKEVDRSSSYPLQSLLCSAFNRDP